MVGDKMPPHCPMLSAMQGTGYSWLLGCFRIVALHDLWFTLWMVDGTMCISKPSYGSWGCTMHLCMHIASRPGHGLVATVTYTPWGGQRGSEAKKKVCVPKMDLQIRAPLIHFIFFLRTIFLMWVGGWIRQRSSGCYPPPPPGER